MVDRRVSLDEIPDDELARIALSADPDPVLPADAEPLVLGDESTGLLPEWYMPAPRGLRRTTGRRVAVAGVVISLLVVNGAGLCVTYGWPEIAW